MKLTTFRVTKFRNIVDSGPIDVDASVTCLVGKNEAGKSALLEALYLLNPAYDEKFDVEDQYPRWLVVRDRKVGDLSEHAPVRAEFSLEANDLAAVRGELGDGVLTSESVSFEGGDTTWSFSFDEPAAIENLIAEMPASVSSLLAQVDTLGAVCEILTESTPVEEVAASDIEGDEAVDTDHTNEAVLTANDLELANAAISGFGLSSVGVRQRIEEILQPRLPLLFRFTAYNMLPGRVDFREISKEDEGPGESGLQTVRALLRLAETDVAQLAKDDYELRKGELEAVQIELTNQVFEYWRQNPDLEVQIDVDKVTEGQPPTATAVARYLDIRLKDRRSGYSNNFSQRSSGFQWFFSFLAAFSQFEGEKSPIVLLDEPALTLHAKAQADFLRFINERLSSSSPVIYTTHSPFMVEADRLERVRIVEDHGPPEGATSSDEVLAADPDSLFPLQAALGYDIAQSLFVGPHNLVVEGTSDYIYLTVMSRLCISSEGEALDERWRILPAGGATNIPTFVSLVGPHLDVTVLADSDTKGMRRISNMIRKGLLQRHRLVMANEATSANHADVEDLFSVGDYLKLYNITYGASIKAKDLPQGDRVVKRIEALVGATYGHGEVAEALPRYHHEIDFTAHTLGRFSELIKAINNTIGT